MALLFLDSLDHYATADVALKWTSSGVNGLGGHSIAIQAGGGRRGSQSFRWRTGTEVGFSYFLQGYLSKTLTAAATGILGFAYQRTGNPGTAGQQLAAFRDGATSQVSLRLNADLTLSALRGHGLNGTVLGTSSATLTAGSFHYLELQTTIHGSAGTVAVVLNGVSVLSLTGQNTQQTATATWNTVAIGQIDALYAASGTGVNETIDFDDVYVLDTTGAAPLNAPLGDVRVDAHYPNAVGTTSNWTRSTGADQWATIDEALLNSDTDYNDTTTVGHKDTLNFPSLTHAGGTIRAVQVCCAARKTDASAGALASVIRHAGTDAVATGQTLTTTYAVLPFLYPTNPGTSAAWTEADFNAAEFGYQKTA